MSDLKSMCHIVIVWAIMECHIDLSCPKKNVPGIGGTANKGREAAKVTWDLCQSFG